MKVLFAVSNDGVTSSVLQKYQLKYKEIITKKCVYYFNAIIKELQKDRTYDALVIGEDLEPLANNDYAQADKFIFEKLDEISDEASKSSGEDIPIIFICADRRTREDALLIKLFGIGIYNALVENDRSIEKVCELICKPRTKKEAKNYYKIEGGDVSYSPATDSEIDEAQVQNILNYFAKVGNNEQKIVQTFDHIADQYTDTQLRLIVNVLPLPVKATLESSSPRYQKLMNGGTVLSNGEYQKYSENNPKKPTSLDAVTVIDITDSRANKRRDAAQVVIPSSMNFGDNSNIGGNTVDAYNNQRKNENMNENENINPNMNQNYGGVVTPNANQNPYGNPYANPYGQQMPYGGQQMPYGQMPPMGNPMGNQMPNQPPMGGYGPQPMPNQMPMGGYGPQPMPNQMPVGNNPMPQQPGPMQVPGGQPMNPQPVQPNPNTNVDPNMNNIPGAPVQGNNNQMPGQVPFGVPPMPGTNPNEQQQMNTPVTPVQESVPMPEPIPMPTEPEPQPEVTQVPVPDMSTTVETSSLGMDNESMGASTGDEFTSVSMDEVPQTDMQTLPTEGSPYVSDTNSGEAFITDTVPEMAPQDTMENNDTTVNFDSLNASDSEGPLPGFEAVEEDEKKDDEGTLPGFEEVNTTPVVEETPVEPQIEMPVEPMVEPQVQPQMETPVPGPNPMGPAPMGPGPMPNQVPPAPQPQMPQGPNTAFDPNYMPNSDYGQASTYNQPVNNYGTPQPMNVPMPNNNFGQQPPMGPNVMPNPNGGAPVGNGDGSATDSQSADDGSGVLSNQ